MTDAHVVGIDLQLGFGVNLGLFWEQEIFIQLRGIAAGGVLFYHHSTFIKALSVIVSDGFVILIAWGAGGGMRDFGGIG